MGKKEKTQEELLRAIKALHYKDDRTVAEKYSPKSGPLTENELKIRESYLSLSNTTENKGPKAHLKSGDKQETKGGIVANRTKQLKLQMALDASKKTSSSIDPFIKGEVGNKIRSYEPNSVTQVPSPLERSRSNSSTSVGRIGSGNIGYNPNKGGGGRGY